MHIPTYTTHEGDLRFATNEEVSHLRGYSQPKINGNLLHVGHYLLLMTEDGYTRLSHWVNGKEEDGKWIPTDRDNVVFPDYNFSNLIGMHWYAFLTVQPADVKVGVDGKQTDIVSPDNNFSSNNLDPYQYSPAFSVTGSELNTEITNKLHNFVFDKADLNLIPDTDDSDKYTVTLSDTGLAHLQRVLGSDFKAEKENYTGSLTVKQQRRLTVNFVDQDGNTVSSKDYTDFKNSTINLNLSVPDGYILPAGTEIKSVYELGNSNATYNVPVLTLQSAKITFFDQTAGTDLTEFNSDGGYGTKIDFDHDINAVINSYLQNGYKLVSSDFNSEKTYAENNNSNVFKVVLAHRMINVASTGKTTSDLISDTNKHYPAGVSASDLNSDTTRVIKYYYAGNSTEFNSVKQTVKFDRTAVVDAVTGKIAYTDWQVSDPAKSEFKSVVIPIITGYTPDKTAITELKAEPNDNVVVKVVYTANDQSAVITVYDQTANKSLSEYKISKNGKYNTAIDWNTDVADLISVLKNKGYVITANNVPASAVFKSDNKDNQYQIIVKHRIVTVDSTDPKSDKDIIPDTQQHYPANVSASDLNSEAKRTIKYYYAGNLSEFNSEKQIVKFKRSAMVDAVTGKVIYTDWQADNPDVTEFKSVAMPSITGYTPNKTTVTELKAEPNDNILVKVIYTANMQNANVTVYDETAAKDLSEYKISQTGQYNTAINWNNGVTDLITELKNKGYIAVSDNVPADAVLKADNQDNQYKIVVKHKLVTVDNTDSKLNKDIIPNTTQHYPTGVAYSDLNTDAKRTIKYYYANNSTEFNSAEQIVKFKRSATVDAVTGNITYSDWQASNPDVTEFKLVVTPSITGYTPDKTAIAELKAVPDDNIVVKVIYTANTQNANVTVYDETDKKNLSEYKISKSGKYNTAINWNTNVADLISELKNKGYLIASNNMPANTVFKSDDKDNQYQIIVKHKIVTVTASDPKSEQDIIAGTTQHYPVGVTKSDLNSDATRKIVYQYEDGKVIKTVLQSVTFSRNATVDAVTGKITYTDFKADQDYPVAISPAITGYMPDQSEIKSEKAELGKNVTVVVTYKADLETVTVIAKDEQGNGLKQYTLSGKYGSQYSTKASDFKLSSDYQLVKEPANKTGKFSTDNKPVIYIFKKVVTPTIPDTNSDKDKDKQPEPDKPHGTDTKPDEIIIPNIKDNDQSEIKSDKKIPDSKIKNNTVLILNQKKNEKGKSMKVLPVTDINNRNINNNVAVKGIDKVDKISRTDFKSDEIGNTNKVISKKNIITDIKNSNKLPQTGDDSEQLKWSGIGLVALALAMIGFSFKSDGKNRKRK